MRKPLATLGCLLLLAGTTSAFDQRELSADWEWLREAPTEWSLVDGMLRIRTQPDRIWGGNGSRNVLLARKPVPRQAEAVADVELENPTVRYEQCGLLVYEHDDAFVKLILEHIDGLHYVVMAWEGDGQGKVIAKIEIPARRVQLRYTVDGDRVTGFWRLPDTPEWNKAAECSSPARNQPRFGLFTQDGPRDEKHWALVRQLQWHATIP